MAAIASASAMVLYRLRRGSSCAAARRSLPDVRRCAHNQKIAVLKEKCHEQRSFDRRAIWTDLAMVLWDRDWMVFILCRSLLAQVAQRAAFLMKKCHAR
jgi:hypothetical protein